MRNRLLDEERVLRLTNTWHSIVFQWCLTMVYVVPTVARQCSTEDFFFEYTNCDDKGQRWRVAIPRDENFFCDGGAPLPTRGINCSFSCAPGMFLDVDTQSCRHCSKGSYSLGGGMRLDEFTRLPPGFVVENIGVSSEANLECSSESGWIVKNSELMYVPSRCLSNLIYSVNLVRTGYVDYSFRMPKNSRGLVFKVTVKNEQCQSYRDSLKPSLVAGSGVRDRTGDRAEEDGEWSRRRIALRSGLNVITWSVENNRDTFSTADVITVARIDVLGIPFTQQCTLCPAGTYSGEGAKECIPCAQDYYSTKGSSQCGKCPLSQFSGPKAAKCIDRPPCTSEDYYPENQPCVNGKMRTVYKKVLPSVCRDDVPEAVKPPPAGERGCPKCNPGMSVDGSGNCVFCPKDHFSDGNGCKRCPVDTIPNYGFQYTVWNNLPPHMATKCEFVTEDSLCDVGESWLPAGDVIHSSPTHEKGVALELMLRVTYGFSNPLFGKGIKPSAQSPVARITFEFETSCADASCVLYFVEDPWKQSFYRLIADFNGTQHRRTYSHPILSNEPTKFLFAFMRSRSSTEADVITDRATIYAINVTNVANSGGGASACLKCPTSGGKCVACPPGRYISQTGSECKKCPTGSMLNASSDRVGIGSCVPCGPNLISEDGVRCTSNGFLELPGLHNTTNKFDFSSFVNRTFNATGVKVFAREGTSYFHSFNISLFNEGLATCRETLSPSDFGQTSDIGSEAREVVEAFVCRSTALPLRVTTNTTQKLVYVSPLLLGDKLIAITMDKEYGGIKLGEKELDLDEGSSSPLPDVHLFYESTASSSDVCPHRAVITARCDPRRNGDPEVRLPRACPDGTCDGCLYHVIVITAHACPICTEHDYTVIRGECVNGQLTVHSIPARHCVLSGAESKERTEACSSLTPRMQILVFAIVCTALALCIAVILVCQRNRRLEYKYMKLVESKGAPNGVELPGAESCGVEDGEDDEEVHDRVFFAKGKKRLFGGVGRNRREAGGEKSDGECRSFVALEETE